MDTQSLEEYLARSGGQRRSSPRSSSNSNNSRFSNRTRAGHSRSISQAFRIPSLRRLWDEYTFDRQAELVSALDLLRVELLELEQNHSRVLINPSVVQSAIQASKHAQLAASKWRGEPYQAARHADQAVILQMHSLTEGYHTVAGDRMIDSRKTIESMRLVWIPGELQVLHKKARSLYKEAKKYQDMPNVEKAFNYTLARRLFTEVIYLTEEIDIKADDIRARRNTVALLFGLLALIFASCFLLTIG